MPRLRPRWTVKLTPLRARTTGAGAPIFSRGKDGQPGKLVAFAIAVAHLSDIGGRQWSADAGEMYEEGIRFPVIKLAEGGRMNPWVMQMLEANVRLPQQVRGDIEAQMGALRVADRRLAEMLEEYGLEGIDDIAAAIFHASEEAALRDWRGARVPARGCSLPAVALRSS